MTHNKEAAELLPCPFFGAGSDRIILQIQEPHTHTIATFMPDYPGSATIECGGCNVGMIEDTKEEVIAAWNRRTASEAAAQRLRAAIIQTLNANRHLADGDNCTLLPLKIALRESGAPWEGDSGGMVEQEAQEPGEREAALQGLIDQAQELDMGYGPNACPTCGKSGGMPIHSITFCNASFNGTPPGCNHEGTCEEWKRAIEARSKAQGGKQ